MSAPLANKAFIITGGAAGIGLSTVKTLLSRGAALGVCDIHEENLRSAFNSLSESEKSRVLFQKLNVTDRTQVKDFLAATKKQFHQVHGVANIAGVTGKSFGVQKLWDVPMDEYDFVMDVNVRGSFNFVAEALRPGFLEEGSSIVNVGSVASLRGYDKGAVYPVSKHAVIGLTKGAAKEGGSREIRVNAVLPGPIQTQLLREATIAFGELKRPSAYRPFAREGNPQELANVISFLLGPESTYVTGAVWAADGGSLA
ncbi:oxidoreductase [Talaromyces proteolyticus]|uniref:Oxidoreductase n=1 Tax=Talaromyces proteolyticus TaxID=1131652 RepID=A0AAD4PSE8_9EURO|nr:oxidoreductase [Talaromyces proteolyticus]KAH8688740.1 oxidoreductase [Talaromyces proteolyticus]